MEGLIPLVYRTIVEYRKARHQVAIASRLLYGDHHQQPCGSSALFRVVDPAASSSSSSSWHAASSSMSPATSPAAARASGSLASPLLLRSASRRQLAG